MILLDTSGLFAVYNSLDAYHDGARSIVYREDLLILSPFVLAEIDYMITQRVGMAAAQTVLEDVTLGAYEFESFNATDVAAALSIIDRYADLGIGLADASLVVLAERHGCFDILTLDQRHFRAITSPSGRSFRLLPMDDDSLN